MEKPKLTIQTDGLPGSSKATLKDFNKNVTSILSKLTPAEARLVGTAIENFGAAIVEQHGETAGAAS